MSLPSGGHRPPPLDGEEFPPLNTTRRNTQATRHPAANSTSSTQQRKPLLPTPNSRPNTSSQANHRILLRFTNPSAPTDKSAIFQVTFQELNTPLTRLTPTKNGFYANTDDLHAIDTLTSSRAIDTFRKINITPVIPPEQRSKRTIFIRQLDSYAGQHSAEQIKQEIENKNTWIKLTEVIKIKQYTHLIKIICTETSTATKILDNGLQMFNTRITPQQCEREIYTLILTCFKCYKYEDHPTKQCTSTVQICSECAETGHTFEHCTNNYKRCINCNNNHRTLSAGCQVRKQAIANKEQQEKQHPFGHHPCSLV